LRGCPFVWKLARAENPYSQFQDSALVHELLGCLEGLKMAATIDMMHIVLETDAANVKIALESDKFRQSPVEGVITESSNILSYGFGVYCV